MSLIPTVYSSADPGAPGLTAAVGSLITVLDAILVDGYGVGAGRKEGLGWTRQFSSGNRRVYRGNPVSGSGHCIRVNNEQQFGALLHGFSSMTGIDEGTDMFPLPADYANGIAWPACTTANPTVARRWWAIGNERCLYFYREPQVNAANPFPGTSGFMGDFLSRMAVDPSRCAITTHGSWSGYDGTGNYSVYSHEGIAHNAVPALAANGFSIARSFDGAKVGQYGRVMKAGECGHTTFGNGVNSDSLADVYPDPVTGGLLYAPVWLREPGGLRGLMPGMYTGLHRLLTNVFAEGQILENVPGMPAGTRWIYKKGLGAPGGTTVSGVFFDLTNPWE